MLHQTRHHKRWAEWSTKAKAGVLMGILLGLPGIFALCGVITMALWNALMPELFRLPSIGFWQALGLLALSHILFKGAGGRAARNHWRKREVWRHMQEDTAAKPEHA
jgi:hypothetical protein